MIRIFYHKDGAIEKTDELDFLSIVQDKQLLWVDLQFPSQGEQRKVEKIFNINFDKQAEESDLESNIRFYETAQFIYINSNFTSKNGDIVENSPVIFYLQQDILITKRDADLVPFAEIVKKIKRNPQAFKDGNEILIGIMETKVDMDSDHLESISREIAKVGKNLSSNTRNVEDVLLKINAYQESAMYIREAFVDKLRVISSLVKCNSFASTPRPKVLLKDINSMLDFTSFLFKRLEYLQNTLMGLVNIEQNKAIKIFTIVSVVFMPPTLIASIYGMNFRSMPELGWRFGYPAAIIMIIVSSLMTFFIFKKKWL